MLILKCQEADLRSSLSRIPRLAENLVYADVCSSLSSIQMLAEQILCYRVDFYCAGGRSNLRLLSRSAIPQECQSLADLFDNEHMALILRGLADDSGIHIHLEKLFKPSIMWLVAGGVTNQNDRLAIFTILRRPKPGSPENIDENTVSLPDPEPPCIGIVDRPVHEAQRMESSFTCHVGDIIVLEAGEGMRVKASKQANIEDHDICVLSTIFRTTPKKNGPEIAGS